VNATIARLTWRSLVGRRRAVLLYVLPVTLVLLTVVLRLVDGQDPGAGTTILGSFALGIVVPLLGLIAGTGSIGPEIDDGSIVYLLAKPISRFTIILSKLGTAIVVVSAFATLPTLVAGLIIAGTHDRVAVGYAVGVFVAGIAYSALFLLLAVLTRNAVVFGLGYALLWETLVGGYIPGAQALSVQQWSVAITRKIMGPAAGRLEVESAVHFGPAVALLAVLTLAATWYAGWRLRSIRLTGDE
jgi:ABC-2 type transport system permease protein